MNIAFHSIRLVTLVFLVLLTHPLAAESNEELLRAMQARITEQQIETDFASPKTPEIEADRAVLGDRKAPITIVTYSDFQCPYCRKGAETVEAVRKKYGKKVLFVFKNFPLPFHAFAMAAAQRFEAIGRQSAKKAYLFHDYLFAHQEQLESKGVAFLDEAAKKVGANMAKMKTDMESDSVKTRIATDTAEAQKYELSGTPGFVVAGVLLKGAYPAAMFETIIDRRLKNPARQLGSQGG